MKNLECYPSEADRRGNQVPVGRMGNGQPQSLEKVLTGKRSDAAQHETR